MNYGPTKERRARPIMRLLPGAPTLVGIGASCEIPTTPPALPRFVREATPEEYEILYRAMGPKSGIVPIGNEDAAPRVYEDEEE